MWPFCTETIQPMKQNNLNVCKRIPSSNTFPNVWGHSDIELEFVLEITILSTLTHNTKWGKNINHCNKYMYASNKHGLQHCFLEINLKRNQTHMDFAYGASSSKANQCCLAWYTWHSQAHSTYVKIKKAYVIHTKMKNTYNHITIQPSWNGQHTFLVPYMQRFSPTQPSQQQTNI